MRACKLVTSLTPTSSCPHSTYDVYTPKKRRDAKARRCRSYDRGRIRHAQCTPLPRQPRRETPRRRAERGTESKEAEAPLAGCSRRVTPLAFIHRRVRPLDGRMVVANPYRHCHMAPARPGAPGSQSGACAPPEGGKACCIPSNPHRTERTERLDDEEKPTTNT